MVFYMVYGIDTITMLVYIYTLLIACSSILVIVSTHYLMQCNLVLLACSTLGMVQGKYTSTLSTSTTKSTTPTRSMHTVLCML